MIKAEELMLGDVVTVNRSECVADGGRYMTWKQDGKIILIEKDYIRVQYEVDEVDDWDDWEEVDMKDIEPIPITPEILEKNGFSGEMYAFCKINDEQWLEYYYHEHRLRKWWRGIDEWNNHADVTEVTFECQCHYVHELQHALRLCGITKTIEL